MIETTDNAFLGGRLHVLQPKSGYRAGADPVLLAAAVAARPGESVLDLGCGVGTAMLCLQARVRDVAVTGIEVQADLVALARKNIERNDLSGDVYCADIAHLPASLKQLQFDHVMSNPPFFDRASSSPSEEVGREMGRGENQTLAAWIDVALRRLKPKGHLTLINRIERLPDCLNALHLRAGDIVVRPLAPRLGRPAKLFLLSATKDAKGQFVLATPFVLHEGPQHDRDGDSYTADAQDILRNGKALSLLD